MCSSETLRAYCSSERALPAEPGLSRIVCTGEKAREPSVGKCGGCARRGAGQRAKRAQSLEARTVDRPRLSGSRRLEHPPSLYRLARTRRSPSPSTLTRQSRLCSPPRSAPLRLRKHTRARSPRPRLVSSSVCAQVAAMKFLALASLAGTLAAAQIHRVPAAPGGHDLARRQAATSATATATGSATRTGAASASISQTSVPTGSVPSKPLASLSVALSHVLGPPDPLVRVAISLRSTRLSLHVSRQDCHRD